MSTENIIQPDQDYLTRALCVNGKIRAYAVRTTQVTDECRKRHDMWATASAAVGRTLSVGAMMGGMLKGNDRLTLQVQGDGPLGQILVDANAKGQIRGSARHPQVHFPLNEQGKLDVGQAVGRQGSIYVIKHLGLKEPYQGSSPLVSGEIGEDFTYYFAQSEQTPSAVAVGVMIQPDHTVKASGGYIIQLMPGVEESAINDLERRLQEVTPVSTLVDEGSTPEQMIEHVFPNESIQWLEKMPVHFHCECSEERVKTTLISLGKEEVDKLIKEQGYADVQCHFCNESYHLDRGQLEELLQQME